MKVIVYRLATELAFTTFTPFMINFSSGTDSKMHSIRIIDSNQPSVESERCSDIEWIRTLYIEYQPCVVSKFGESTPPFVKIGSDLKNMAAFVSAHIEYTHAICTGR